MNRLFRGMFGTRRDLTCRGEEPPTGSFVWKALKLGNIESDPVDVSRRRFDRGVSDGR